MASANERRTARLRNGGVRALAIAALACGAVGACGSASCGDAAVPGGAGGGNADTGVDAGRGGGSGVGGSASTTLRRDAAAGGSGHGGSAVGGGGPPPDAAADAEAGEVPTWTKLGADIAGCAIERLTNKPGAVRAFAWTPCSGQPCDQTALAPGVHGEIFHAVAAADGGSVKLALNISDGVSSFELYTDPTGAVVDGYRVLQNQFGKPDDACLLAHPSVRNGVYGFFLVHIQGESKSRLGGLLRSYSGGDPVLTFDIEYPGPTGVDESTLGDTRWAWQDYPPRLRSVATAGSPDAVVFAPFDAKLMVSQRGLTTSGSVFFFQRTAIAGGTVQYTVFFSDGVVAPQPFLSTPQGTHDGMPVFADSHFAWFRGVGFKDLNKFQTVEIWASPFAAEPAKIVPQKLGEHSLQAFPDGGRRGVWGGFGRLAVLGQGASPDDFSRTDLWNLKTGSRSVLTLPGGLNALGYAGLTSTEIYILGGPDNASMALFRYALPK